MTLLQDLSNNKEKAFWFFQISGWSVFYLQHIFVFSPLKEFSIYNLFIRTVILLLGFSISIFLRYRLKKIDYLRSSFFSILIIILISSLICASVWHISGVVFSESMLHGFITFGKATFEDIIVGIARDNVVFIGWSGLYFGIKFWMSWISQKEMTDKALSLARNAQLEMLRYQLNPHFLFNTLSSLRALTSDDNKKAKEIITKISEFLRYSLIESENNEVPLSKEIEVIKNYLDIEKVRFEDELVVDFDIDQIAEVYPIPIFLVHPLVENAIKHGMHTSPIPLKILISAKMSNGFLNIKVLNTGRWVEKNKENNTGRGIDNIKRRLKIYAPRQHSFQVMKNADSVEVNISIRKKSDEFNNGTPV